MSEPILDAWAASNAYEDFMGRWSRPLALAFVRWLNPPPGSHWLDVGTGTGALASAVCALADPASVVGCDPAVPFIEAARRTCVDPRARFEVAGVGGLPRRADEYDAVVSALALNFFPDPQSAVAEMLSVARSGGLIGAVVWDYSSGMEFLRRFWDVASAIDPRAVTMDEGSRFPICRPDALHALFESAGAGDVRVEALAIPTIFHDFEDFWRPLLGGTGPAPTFVADCSPRQLTELRDGLIASLGGNPEAAIHLHARAWAIVGRVT